MRRVRSTLSGSDNIAISVQVQLDLDFPTGTESKSAILVPGNISAKCTLVRSVLLFKGHIF